MNRVLVFALLVLFLAGCGTSMDPFVGLEQAEREAEYYRSQLTATTVSRELAVTETSAAFGMMQTQTAWVYTATAISWTPTPLPTSTPVPTATLDIQATGTAASILLAMERGRSSNTVRAMSGYVAGFLALVLVVMLTIVAAKRLAKMPTPIHDGTGKPMPILDAVDGTWVDLDRSPNGAVQVEKGFLKLLPVVTAERQDAVTNRAQLVDLKSRTRITSAAVARLLESQGLGDKPMLEAPKQLSAGDDALFPLPSWDLVNGWQGDKKLLPYGLTSSGLGYVNVDVFPHWAAIGMTGMGKSRRFMRPLIAFALAAGHRVVIIGKMTDYGVFASHPNATLVHVNQMTKPEHAEFYGAALLALLREMEVRDHYLMNRGVSTWAQAGRSNTFIVLDEVQNAIRMMKVSRSTNADRVQMGVAGLVSEGRKVGFNVAIAAQRATGLADVLSQTGKAIFRVEREEENAHKSLVGASNLSEGYFYARFGDVRLAGAFEPTDEQIRSFLGSRPVSALDADWVDGTVVDSLQARLPEMGNEPSKLTYGGLSAEEGEKVVSLLRQGRSASATVRELWGVTGGDRFLRLIDEVKGFQKFMNTEGVQA